MLIYTALAIITLLAFEGVRHNQFVNYDDDEYVTENPHVNRGISKESIIWAFTHSAAGNWHPLTWISHMLDCQLFGLNAGSHHLVNLLLHIINALLLFLLFNLATARPWESFFIAAVFAVHPLHVESVAWAAERKDLLSTFLGLLAMIFYVKYAKSRHQTPDIRHQTKIKNLKSGVSGLRSQVLYAACLAAYAFSLMSKPMLVPLPFLLLLLDYWPLNRLNKGTFLRLLTEKTPLLVMSASSCVVTYLVQHHSGAMESAAKISIASRTANAIVSYIRYIGKVFWPADMAVLYPHPKDGLSAVSVTACIILLMLITAAVFYFGRNGQMKFMITGWLWYLGMLVPVIGIVQVGEQAMADRYTYLPAVGIFLSAAFFAAIVFKNKPLPAVITAAVIITVLIPVTRQQVCYWKDSFSLFEHSLKATKDNAIMHNNFGDILIEQKRYKEAMVQFEQAIAIKPDYTTAKTNKGKVLEELGRTDEAITVLTDIIKAGRVKAETFNYLGLAYAAKGDFDAAVNCYNEALKIKKDHFQSLNNLGVALNAKGQTEQAVEKWKQVLAVRPDHFGANYSLGIAAAKKGRFKEASGFLEKAIKARPDSPEGHYNLACVYYQIGKLDLCAVHCKEALRLKPDYAEAAKNLEYTMKIIKQSGRSSRQPETAAP